jgi:pimeloyl-ACP methyl ester carboxylesterase
VPTIILHGEGDGIARSSSSASQSRFFTGSYQYRLIPVIGHNVPQEAPKETAAAVLELLGAAR